MKNQTAPPINGITFKLTEENGEYEGVCLNPKDIPPDDLDDVVFGKTKVQELLESGINKNNVTPSTSNHQCNDPDIKGSSLQGCLRNLSIV